MALSGAFAVSMVYAAAPVEERRSSGAGSVADGQQRLAFLRREINAAELEQGKAELELKDAQAQESGYQKQLEAARKRLEAAAKQVESAKQRTSAARKAYDQESAEFERVLRDNAGKGGNKPAKK